MTIFLHVDDVADAVAILTAVQAIAKRHTGRVPLRIVAGPHTLALGAQWSVAASTPCLTALRAYGRVELGP